jgi:hypothetical protein
MPEYTLKSGDVLLLSDEDADLLAHRWYQQQRKKAYVFRTFGRGGKGYSEFVHRLVLARMIGRPLEKSEDVDHINGDHLDNRRENLRIATRAQNIANNGLRATNTSGYKGVTWSKSCRKWLAQLYVSGERHYLGMFLTREEAYEAYAKAARELYGDYACLDERSRATDIPEWTEEVYEYVSRMEQLARDHNMTIAEFLVDQLNQRGGNIKRTARELGFHVQYLWRWIYKLDLRREAKYARNTRFLLPESTNA